MRIALVDTYYPAFLTAHYAARPPLASRPYAEQLDSLLAASFGTSDAYSRGLRALGHEATDLIVNCAPLQDAWAGTRAARLASRAPTRYGTLVRARLARRVAHAQIRALDAEVVYLQDLWFFARGDLDRLRADGRLVVGQTASPAPPDELLQGYDLLLTSFPHFVPRFRALGVDARELRIAFDPEAAVRLGRTGDPGDERDLPVSFVGSVSPRVHGQGTRLLERAVGGLPDLQLWGYGAGDLDADSPLLPRYRGEAWALEMYDVLARSRIALNRHIDVAEGHANNMRLYEATGMGACLVTDRGSNLSDLFVPGEEVVAYDSADDLVTQVRALQADDDRRVAIARAGRARTLRDHTYAVRMRELDAILRERLG